MKTERRQALEYTPLCEDYLDQVMAIEVEAYPESWTNGMFREEMKSARSYFRVAFHEGDLIGYCGFWMVIDEAHITSVTVKSELRGRGFGREQVLHLLDVARERGAKMATLEVRESNVVAKRLYESLGFRASGVRRGYYSKTNEDAIIMTRELG